MEHALRVLQRRLRRAGAPGLCSLRMAGSRQARLGPGIRAHCGRPRGTLIEIRHSPHSPHSPYLPWASKLIEIRHSPHSPHLPW